MRKISNKVDGLLSTKAPFIAVILKSIGQIMLQDRALTGLLFLIGISIGSYIMGIATIIAVISGNIIAMVLKYDKKDIEAGLYGFSPALVGVSLILFYKPTIIVWLAIVVGSMLTAMLQHFFIVKKISVFTFPFVLMTWIIMYIFNNVYVVDASSMLASSTHSLDTYLFPFRGVGQVIFQDKIIVGVIFLIGLLVSSPISALFALIGSIISGWMAGFLSMPMDVILMGLFSYNAVLCAIVFADKKTESIGWAALSVALSLLIAIVMFQFGLTQLTFPFVAAAMIVISSKKKMEKRIKMMKS